MKKIATFFASLLLFGFAHSQCTTSNATSCQCDTLSLTNCNLLPDITISWYGILNYMGGPNEYSQTGNGVDNGRLKVTGSTPNIGKGPLTVRGLTAAGQRKFVCGTDTFLAAAAGTFVCPNGYPLPRQITMQRIYHKNGNTMTYWDRDAGAMTYHPSHGHIHNDEWGTYTLRIQDVTEPNPLNWSIVGSGKKLGFCLMDYYQCSDASANNHCKDDNTIYNQGTTLYNGDFPNFQLGGGVYGCSPTEQGISSGYTDVYSESLDGMWINIPPGTCNGNYWIVYEVDPNNYFMEEDETNNWTAVPYTLTQQAAPGNPIAEINSMESPNVCTGDSVWLRATAGTAYAWSNGATTQDVLVGPGTYSVTVTNYCGTAASPPFTVASSLTPATPVCVGDSVCPGMPATLTATGNNIVWIDSTGIQVGTGNTFITPNLTADATYYAFDQASYTGAVNNVGKLDTVGAGAYSNSTNYLLFNVYRQLTLKSVAVHANGAGLRTIQLQDEIGIIIQAATINIPNGPSRINLNFEIPPGLNYSLRVSSTLNNLWRNTGGVTYPYTMTDTLSITNSSAGPSNYYFFYDWDVEVGGAVCSSPTVPVIGDVVVCNSIDESWNLDDHISVQPNPSNGNFQFDMLMPAPADITVTIRDISGRVIYANLYQNATGQFNSEINLGEVSQGIYLMDVAVGNKNYFRKLIVQ